MNKFITIGNEKVSITEIENAKTIPELLQTRVQYAILDQLNDMVARSGMGNPDEVKNWSLEILHLVEVVILPLSLFKWLIRQ